MGLLEGKTALITGAARGIGKAIALKFAEEGANIAFTDLEVNEETEKEIAAKGVKAKATHRTQLTLLRPKRSLKR